MRKPAVLLGLLAAIGALVATALAVMGSPARAQTAPLTIYAGQGSGPIAEEDFIGDPAYGGNTVRISVGQSIIWSLRSDESHTVTFPAGESLPDIFIPQP